MKNYLKRIYNVMCMLGVDPIKFFFFIKGLPFYLYDQRSFLSQQKKSRIQFSPGKMYPILSDKLSNSGIAGGHYFHQDLLVARRIFVNEPKRHVDIGSRVDGFAAHVASFRKIEVFDIRPLTKRIYNILFIQKDLMGELDDSLVDYTDSVSCLHALEHFGLGRYGDPVRYDGYLNALKNITGLLQKGGKFYFSVPIGPQRVEFNAHRVFSLEYLFDLLGDTYNVDMFSYVDDVGELHEQVSFEDKKEVHNNFGCYFGCGIFELTKT